VGDRVGVRGVGEGGGGARITQTLNAQVNKINLKKE
jgi:hypothetical protein